MVQVYRSRAGIDECPLRAASRMTGPRAYYYDYGCRGVLAEAGKTVVLPGRKRRNST